MATFDVFAVGCGGGPYEDNLSSYFLKASGAPWEDGIVALEAGSALGAVRRLLGTHPEVFGPPSGSPKKPTPAELYSWIRCYLITHPHLDHLSGLVLSAGSTKCSSTPVYGTRHTLDVVADIFSGKIWPALASWTEEPGKPLVLSPLSPADGYVPITDTFSVRTMEVSHGPSSSPSLAQPTPSSSSSAPYKSSAFFVRHDPSARELLFFGDVEPDALSSHPQNREVWRTAAPKIPDVLSALFIECSWPAGRPDELLYGHLSPAHLADELTVLAREVVASRSRSRADSDEDFGSGSDREAPPRGRKRRRRSDSDVNEEDVRGALAGLRVFVIHCKDDLHETLNGPIHDVIAGQVRALVEERALGAEVVAVEQGMLISI
ncbi:cAMP phosphodiesterases class-II-domain-containing protein [Trametes punicea]|nr:cAMP phosphodiesterases class-II-domain-containing protein [Trametes punicea]